MRKISAILLISLFAFSQYARQLSYLECKFSNILKPGTAKCDCEKQAGLTKQDSNPVPAPKIHTHIHLDEFFSATKEFIICSHFRFLKTASDQLPGDEECDGIISQPWQPPNT